MANKTIQQTSVKVKVGVTIATLAVLGAFAAAVAPMGLKNNPDLILTNPSIDYHRTDEGITVQFTVTNIGKKHVRINKRNPLGVEVSKFFQNGVQSSNYNLSIINNLELKTGQSMTFGVENLIHRPFLVDALNLSLKIDPNDVIKEANEKNNSVPVTKPPLPSPDLALNWFTFNRDGENEGMTVLNFEIENKGTYLTQVSDATPFLDVLVTYLDGTQKSMIANMNGFNFTLMPGEFMTVSSMKALPQSFLDIENLKDIDSILVRLDPQNLREDSNRENNNQIHYLPNRLID